MNTLIDLQINNIKKYLKTQHIHTISITKIKDVLAIDTNRPLSSINKQVIQQIANVQTIVQY